MLAEQIITFGLDLPCDLKSIVQKYDNQISVKTINND